MTKILKFILLTLVCFETIAQSVTIDPSSNNSKILDVKSVNKGFMPPKMTTTQRKAISNPEIGLLVFDTNKSRLFMFDGQNWMPLSVSSSDGIDYVQRTATNDSQGSDFGYSVAIDNNWAVVGAPNDSVGNAKKGCVYVFKRENNNWKQKFKIANNDNQASFFGQSVDIQGTTIIIGASGPTFGSGSTFVYNIIGFTFLGQYIEATQFVQKITPPSINNVNSGYFGRAVKINNDRIFIGDADCIINNLRYGAVFIYQKVNNSWVYQSYLNSTIAVQQYRNIKFGHSIEVSGDYLFVGAPSESSYYNLGAVFVYVYGGGTYTLQQRIALDYSVFFGNKLASDGEYLFVTHALTEFEYAGDVSAYKRTGSNWEKVNAPYQNNRTSDFGIGLAYRNGIVAISNGLGTINLYKKVSDNFIKIKSLKSDDISANLFGEVYDIDSNYLITGNIYGQKISFINIEDN